MRTTLVSPRVVQIGGGAVRTVADLLGTLGLTRPLIVTDPFMVRSGLVRRCTEPLEAAGIESTLFSDTVPEPTELVVETGVQHLLDGAFDCLIGFGGGSPIDTAKAIAILAFARRSRPNTRMRDLKVPFAADGAALPLIAIPTTAGTGSEATRFTVITDLEQNEKMLIAGLGALPLAAIVDYELTFSVPARTTADTGIDSLTHALEAFVSRRANAYSDILARSAMRLVGRNLRTVYHEPENASAREAMMTGSLHAGIAFTNASVALVHGMSRPIGANFHVPHGLSNAMLLPAITRFGLEAAENRYADAAREIGFARPSDPDHVAAERLAEGLAALNRDLQVPTPAAFGIDKAEWDAKLERMAQQALASGSPANNPRVPTEAEIVALYNLVWSGNAP